MDDQENLEKKFLKIISIRTSSRAYQMKLKEDDIILCLDGEVVSITYEELSKKLKDIENKSILTILRDGIYFHTYVYGPIGVICEQIDSNQIPDLNLIDLQKIFDVNASYQQYEIYKNLGNVCILLNTVPTILASLAPPLWMIQNRLWMLFGISMVYYSILLIISPWLLCIGWVLKSWYVGNNQIEILQYFYRFNNYKLWLSFCEINDQKAQELARQIDNKIDFDFSYLEPAVIEI
ncbi:hypothetical protein OAD02_03250 [Alphaproteobacteria bacterium]|jgi:hypothetical protein|nr:hypothetical protein [Alphaproteobacteria bacterium]|tara:strand:- start:5 stop:712 length:708 start_codon:yes stop_codon:yes gene_type:complete